MNQCRTVSAMLTALIVAAAALTGCADALSTSGPSDENSAPGAVAGKADFPDEAVVDAETRRADASVMTLHLTRSDLALEEVQTVDRAGTRITVAAISEEHGLALVSETGRIMRLEDLRLSEADMERIRHRDTPASGVGETWREAPQYVVRGVDGERVSYEKRTVREPEVRVPVQSFGPTADHGTWFVSEFGEDIVLMDARDVVVDDQKTLDASYYEDRIWMAEQIIEAFPHHRGVPHHSAWAAHPHGAITVQTEWQMRTGRADADVHGRGQSWWWSDNYALSVWPFLIAKDNYDVFEDIRVIKPKGEKFRDIDDESRRLWTQYFDFLRENPGTDNPPDYYEETLKRKSRRTQSLFWDAHMHSIRVAQNRFESRLNELPPAERKMAEAWGQTVVAYLSAVDFPTDQLVTQFFNGLLPQTVLTGDRFSSADHDLRSDQVFMLRAFHELHAYESAHDYVLLSEVKEKMRKLRDWGVDEHAFHALRELLVSGHGREIVEKLTRILN